MKKKILMGLGSVVTIAAPIAAVISCGDPDIETLKGGSYAKNLGDVQLNKNKFAAAFSDARVLATDASNVVAVGVAEKRIANDGIQARSNMKAHDMHVLQELFIELINSQSSDLKMTIKTKTKSVFGVYNHGNYVKPTNINQKLSYLDKGTFKEKKMLSKLPAVDNTNGGDIFDTLNRSGVTGWKKYKLKKDLKIQFIPSNDPTNVATATQKLKNFLNKNIDLNGNTISIIVAPTYESAAEALQDKTLDVAFLPVGGWATTDANFILQASRDLQVSALEFDGTNATKNTTGEFGHANYNVMAINEFSQLFVKDVKTWAGSKAKSNTLAAQPNLQKFAKIHEDLQHKLHAYVEAVIAFATNSQPADLLAGSYESFIFAHKDNELAKKLLEIYEKTTDFKKDFKLDKKLLKDITYLYTGITSSASYIFPEYWFNKHFGISF